MLSMLLAYDANGNIIGTLDYVIARNEAGDVIGLIDFEAHEDAGGSLTDVWQVENAVGSGTWPEWIGARAHEFKVERAGGKIAALVHRQSGNRRERATVEAAIAERVAKANGKPADIRDLVGGPDRPMLLDDEGHAKARVVPVRPNLPIVRRR